VALALSDMRLHLLTGYDAFYGQSRKPWVSIDTAAFIRHLQGLGIDVATADWHDLAMGNFHPQDATILYSFSQIAHIRDWLKDQLSMLAGGNRLIPSLPLLLCHENKGYAQLYQQSLGIIGPKAWYLCDPRDIPSDLAYPVVLKTISGTNAKGVFLCKDRAELLKRIAGLSASLSLGVKLDHIRRRHLRKGRSYEGYPGFNPQQDADSWLEYMRPGTAFLLQEFIPGLDCDYRVIAIGQRLYVMRRLTHEGDFRASGTKRFEFELEVPDGLLDYALDIYKRFGTPFLSMDIGHSKGRSYLFEYQASHFGTAAIARSRGFFVNEAGKWVHRAGKSDLELTLAQGLAEYLNPEGS